MTPLSDPFYVDSWSGIIRIRESLDRETTVVYNLVVTAQDRDPNGANAKSATANVTLTVTDINDNDPMFSPSHYKVRCGHMTGVCLPSQSAPEKTQSIAKRFHLSGHTFRFRLPDQDLEVFRLFVKFVFLQRKD